MSSQQGYYRFPTIFNNLIAFVSEDNLWQVDLNGVKFCRNILFPLGNKYATYMNEKQASDDKMEQIDLIDCINVILKLKDLNKINKPIRSYLTFDKHMITAE